MDISKKYADILNNSDISGLSEELKIKYIKYQYENNENDTLVLCNSLYEATTIYNNLRTYIDNVLLFPMDDFLTTMALAVSPELKVKRLETLNAIQHENKKLVITNLMGYLKFVPNKSVLQKMNITLNKNDKINRKSFEELIDKYGYTKTSIVTSTGEYSLRGYIIDIFPYNYDNPVRIELFGNQIESIKNFDGESQRTINEIETTEIYPYKELISDNHISILNLLNKPNLIYYDKELILQGYKTLTDQILEYKENNDIKEKLMFTLEELKATTEKNLYAFSKQGVLNIASENIENFNGNYELLINFIKNKEDNHNIYIYITNKIILDFLKTALVNSNSKNIHIIKEKLNKGFIIDDNIFISENDIEKTSQTKNYHNPVKIGRKIKDFSDIKPGDYIVHSVHGIGIYGGIITLEKNGFKKDYILLNYAGNDKVYIPVEKITTIYKYSDAEGTPPKINKLNSTSWIKTKNSVKKRIKDISAELLKLYAERATLKSPKYNHFVEEEVFASEFKYTPTKDQIKCSEDILLDLKKSIPMDRLLCGDVGFGKTEVAFRAIFNTILNGYQVAYLCPTTILSKQQYDSALERFKQFPISIAIVNRFTTTKEFNKILEGLKEGKIDLVFGTHKLFNEKIEYKSLGLLVIDEEQRFGVSQKEKIKELKKNVNILTLSATPIPRTLKMAMSGLKDLSVLDTAPSDRYPVQTYVVEKNDMLTKEAIYKELSRNGQIFYLFNNVKGIENEAAHISKLVPEARVCYAHGQMSKTELEKIIEDFIEYKYDILVCTTIIETGIDIPNVNTLIISDAQNYGLSQLYQLRGRVGRSNKIAYAYLTYTPGKTLSDTAVKRLKAIKEFTELGSGYKIAMRDLAIRGAGDLLGGEQAGFIDSVGIDLYTKLLEEAINELKGIKTEDEDDDRSSLLDVDTHIKTDYVTEESVRIEIHKLINTIDNKETLEKVKSELEDRFGKIDEDMLIYMYEEWFEKLANKLEINHVIQTKNQIEIQIPEKFSNKINGEKLFLKMYNINPKFKIRYQFKKIIISLPIINQPKHYIYYITELLQEIINDIE